MDEKPDVAAPTIRTLHAVSSATTIASLIALFFGVCGILRYRTYTNETFDLAFYTRMTWGMLHLDFWEPILDAHLLGLRLPLALVPVGIVGLAIGIPVALYLAQAAAVAFAAHRLASIGERRFGAIGAWASALALVLHPNVGHVVAYEAHPGTIALAPLALLVDALDRRDGRTLLIGTIGVLLCREDLAIVAMIAAGLLALDAPNARRSAFAAFGVALAYLLVFVLVLHPMYKPESGSLEAHFGPWGRSPGEILRALLTDPARVLAHLGAPRRLDYLPRILAPLALLPLLAPRALLLAAPILAINLLSHFPTTTRIDSHYLTTALPFLVAGAHEGLARLERLLPGLARRGAVALMLASLGGTLVSGLFSPLRPLPRFVRPPVDPHALDRLVAAIPEGVSVQAPDPILPHVAERRVIHRADPFAHDDEAIVLDLSHRLRFAHEEDLLRTTEEPAARALIARRDRRIASVAMPYVLLLRSHADPSRRVDRVRIPRRLETPIPLTACLAVTRIVRAQGRIGLDLVASGPCPEDLAVRLGSSDRPARVDLLFEGLVAPTDLRAGDHVRSLHDDLDAGARTLHVGLLRSSGARPLPDDPFSVELPVE